MKQGNRWVLGADVEPAMLAGVERARLPDFLGIGVQKGGTTWLFENLRRHPELYLPPRKELHFFDRPAKQTLRDYARCFSRAGGRVKGEVTPAYGALPDRTIQLIHAVMPNVRLVLLLRDPIDRAWSQIVMELSRRRGRDVSELSRREVTRFVRSDACRSRSRYVPMLDAWTRSFDPSQLLVGFYDDIEKRPKTLLRSVFRHLGVSTQVDWDALPLGRLVVPKVTGRGRIGRLVPPSRLSAERSPPCPDWAARVLVSELGEDLDELARRYGEPARGWRRRWRRRIGR